MAYGKPMTQTELRKKTEAEQEDSTNFATTVNGEPVIIKGKKLFQDLYSRDKFDPEFTESLFFFKDQGLNKLNEDDKEKLVATYDDSSENNEMSRFAGFKLTRFDESKGATNLLDATSTIKIKTVNLTSHDAPRIQIDRDTFLELRFNDNGELDLENSNFLTLKGASQATLFDNEKNKDGTLVKQGEELKKVLEQLEKFKGGIEVNGEDVLDRLKEKVQGREKSSLQNIRPASGALSPDKLTSLDREGRSIAL